MHACTPSVKQLPFTPYIKPKFMTCILQKAMQLGSKFLNNMSGPQEDRTSVQSGNRHVRPSYCIHSVEVQSAGTPLMCIVYPTKDWTPWHQSTCNHHGHMLGRRSIQASFFQLSMLNQIRIPACAKANLHEVPLLEMFSLWSACRFDLGTCLQVTHRSGRNSDIDLQKDSLDSTPAWQRSCSTSHVCKASARLWCIEAIL